MARQASTLAKLAKCKQLYYGTLKNKTHFNAFLRVQSLQGKGQKSEAFKIQNVAHSIELRMLQPNVKRLCLSEARSKCTFSIKTV
jgi:hypothetical protein